MNLKRAKELRRTLRSVLGTGDRAVTPGRRLAFRHRRYVVAKEGTKLVRTGNLDAKGGPIMVRMFWRTIKLSPNCPRAQYRAMKAAA